jgi:hypothetical protein
MLRLGRPNPRFPASSFKILVFNIFALICNRVRSFFCFGIEVDFHAFWCLANIFTGSVFFSFKGPLYFFFRLGVDIAVFLLRTPLEVAGRGVERRADAGVWYPIKRPGVTALGVFLPVARLVSPVSTELRNRRFVNEIYRCLCRSFSSSGTLLCLGRGTPRCPLVEFPFVLFAAASTGSRRATRRKGTRFAPLLMIDFFFAAPRFVVTGVFLLLLG